MKQVIWRNDDVVPMSTPGEGTYALPIFGPTLDVAWAALRRGGTLHMINEKEKGIDRHFILSITFIVT